MRSHEEIMEEERKAMDEPVISHQEIQKEEKSPCKVKSQEEIMKEEREEVKKHLKQITEIRNLEEGDYFEKITSDYELILEHHESTLHISLNTVKGKNFHLKVCDEGQHQLQNGLLSLDIFEAFKYEPHTCQISHHEGILFIETRYIVGRREKKERKQVKMLEKQLSQATRQKIEFSRLMQKIFQHKKEDQQEIRKKYQKNEQSIKFEFRQQEVKLKNKNKQQQNKYKEEKRIDEEEKMKLLEKERKYLNQIQELEKVQNNYSKMLVDQTTPSSKYYSVQKNNIVRSSEDYKMKNKWGQYQNNEQKMVMLDMMIGQGPFTFRIHLYNVNGGIKFGVTDRLANKNKVQFKHGVFYSYGRIYFGNGNGDYKHLDIQQLTEGMDIIVEVNRSSCRVNFTVNKGGAKGIYGVYSPILNQPNRQFTPAFQTSSKGARISWELG